MIMKIAILTLTTTFLGTLLAVNAGAVLAEIETGHKGLTGGIALYAVFCVMILANSLVEYRRKWLS